MEVLWISADGVSRREPRDLTELLLRGDGIVWVDVPEFDEEAAAVLEEHFDVHPMATRDCHQRTHVPKVHAYPEHLFLILHAPLRGDGGHVHLLELDQFMGPRYLVTVHGPLGEGVPLEPAMKETNAVRTRLESSRTVATSPAELSYAIVSRITRHMENYVAELAREIAKLERRVATADQKDPEQFLEEMFRVRHELLTLRTMAAQSREIYARMQSLQRYLPPEALPLLSDLADQYERLQSLCEQEREFLQGVVDFYQSKTTTKINIAMERLALITAILLPITALASIYGMNLISPGGTRVAHLGVVLAAMAAVTALMLTWTKRHGWW